MRVLGIDILVHHDHVLERGMGSERRHDRILGIALRALFDLDDRMEIAAATLRENDIPDLGHAGHGLVVFGS